ncbi:unnamed protein product [Ambrosiozyma monospora]|uniref:Unnamed protein product n=1 Tax=Ambrosiozyma monospora TaxID=43982 RepID=A0A9W6Z3F4_AMBMO|nr:unnamed protein product [Ambrosiozyma monospora]
MSLTPSKTVGINVASQLPLEIQFIIFKMVIMDLLYYSIDVNRFAEFPIDFCSGAKVVDQLVTMMGYNDMFDEVIGMVIQELNFFSSIFESNNFDQFANFVFSKSFQLKSIGLWTDHDYNANYYNTPNILKLLDRHCLKVFYLMLFEDKTGQNVFHKYSHFMKFITSLVINDTAIKNLPVFFLSQLDRLSTLTLKLFRGHNITILKHILQTTLNKFCHTDGNLILEFNPNPMSHQCVLDSVIQLNDILEKHRNLNILLYINWGFSSNLGVLAAFNRFITEKSPSYAVEIDCRNMPLADIGMLNSVRGLAKLGLAQESDNDELLTTSNQISNCDITCLSLYDVKSLSELSFFNLPNLRHLDLFKCSLNSHAFAKLPETLTKLYLNDSIFLQTNIEHGTHFPTGLTSLTIYGSLPHILNINQLIDLNEVVLSIDSSQIKMCSIEIPIFHNQRNDQVTVLQNISDQLHVFVSRLPNHLRTIRIEYFDWTESNGAVNLPLRNFTSLRDLYLNVSEPSIDVSMIPDLEHLKLVARKLLRGNFPLSIRSLDINLTKYNESLTHFCNEFIHPLQNLLKLKILAATQSSASVDFKKVKFPDYLYSFKLNYIDQSLDYTTNVSKYQLVLLYVVLDGIPPPLNCFFLYSNVRCVVVIDDRKGESIESMKKMICTPHGSWFQYSSSEKEKDSALESLHTLFS